MILVFKKCRQDGSCGPSLQVSSNRSRLLALSRARPSLADWHSWPQAPRSLSLQATSADPGSRLGPLDTDSQTTPEPGWYSWTNLLGLSQGSPKPDWPSRTQSQGSFTDSNPRPINIRLGARPAPVDPGTGLAPVHQGTRPAHFLTQAADLFA